MISVLISSYRRLPLFRRCIHSIAMGDIPTSFEVVVADEESEDSESLFSVLNEYSSYFPFKFIKWSAEKFKEQTGVEKFLNNPAATNNAAFKNSTGDLVFLMGNEIIALPDSFRDMYNLVSPAYGEPAPEDFLMFSTTYDVPSEVLEALNTLGSNFNMTMLNYCKRWPLASPTLHTDVTNYLSLTSRSLWNKLKGYDERYLAGIGKEDSDFVRRCRALPGWKDVTNLRRVDCISLHQFHSGKTHFYDPPASVITKERWEEGATKTRPLYDGWDGSYENKQPWPWGECGVVEILTNTK